MNETDRPGLWTLLEDNTGGYSTLRVCLLIVVLTTMVNWTVACWNSKTLVPLPASVDTILLGMAGVKAAQRVGENLPK